MRNEIISILLFTLCCIHVTHAITPNVLSGILASHMLQDNSTTSINTTHVITTRIEEQLPNGCYRQTIRETRSDNLNKTYETLVWICPAGTSRDSILELECNCSGKCDCSKENETTTAKPTNTTLTTIVTTKPLLVARPHNITKVVQIISTPVNHTNLHAHTIIHKNATDEYTIVTSNNTLVHKPTQENNAGISQSEEEPMIHNAASTSSSMLHVILLITFISILFKQF